MAESEILHVTYGVAPASRRSSRSAVGKIANLNVKVSIYDRLNLRASIE